MSKMVKKSFCIFCLAVLIMGNCGSIEAVGRQGKREVDRVARLAGGDKNGDAGKGDIANKAAQEARAASDAQNIAGKQASHQVKTQLAEKALRAAKAAEAVLIGKVALVEQLAEETKETQSVEREGSLGLQKAHENLNAATRAAKDAHQQVETLRHAVETAKSNVNNARIAADGARKSLNEKEQLLLAAKKRVEELKNRLQKAKGDLAKTNQAAVRADAAAREARVKGVPCNGAEGAHSKDSSNFAQKAAQQAKAASDAQNIAGAQAAHQVKAQLAEKALEAARVVEVELSGKQSIVSQLQQEVKEAEAVVREEMAAIHQSKAHVERSVQAARQAEQELKTLTPALQVAQSNLQNAERGAQGAQHELMEKQQLIQAAKHRLTELLKRLKCAKTELETTRDAVQKANAAAHQAKINAARNKRDPHNSSNMR